VAPQVESVAEVLVELTHFRLDVRVLVEVHRCIRLQGDLETAHFFQPYVPLCSVPQLEERLCLEE